MSNDGNTTHKPSLPPGWEPRISSTYEGKVYYFNRLTGDAVWELPHLLMSGSDNNSLTSSSPSSLSSTSRISDQSSVKEDTELKAKNTKNHLETSSKIKYVTKVSPLKLQVSKVSPLKPQCSPKNTVKRGVRQRVQIKDDTNIRSTSPKFGPAKKFKLQFKHKKSEAITKKKNNTSKSLTIKKLSPLKIQSWINQKPTTDPTNNEISLDKDGVSSDTEKISDMEVDMPVSESETTYNVSDVEMDDISKEHIQDFIKTKEDKVVNAYHIVVDTNVLINNLSLVSDLKDKDLKDSGRPIIVIPWVVLGELNGIKDNKNKSKSESLRSKAREAIRFLNAMWKNKHPRVKGHIDTQDKDDFDKNQPSLKWSDNDDRLIYCCIQFEKKIGTDKVILLTDDMMLRNRTMVNNLRCYDTNSIVSNLEADLEKASHVSTPTTNDAASTETTVLTKEDCIDQIMRSSFKVMMEFLEPFLEKYMNRTFGSTWEIILQRKKPWGILDVLESISKHWISAFGYVLHSSCKSHIDLMRNQLWESKGYIFEKQSALKFLETAILLLTELQKKFPYSNPCERLQELKKEIFEISMPPKEVQPRNCTVFSPLKARFSVSLQISDGDKRVLSNLQNMWNNVFNYNACLILDSLDFPHTFSYDKPEVLPTKAETLNFLPKIFPLMRAIRQGLRRVICATDLTAEEMKDNMNMMYKQFKKISPTLNIQPQSVLPAPMSLQELEAFCFNTDYRMVLCESFQHFSDLFFKVQEAIRNISHEDFINEGRPPPT